MDSLSTIRAYLKDLKARVEDIEQQLTLHEKATKEPRRIWVNFYQNGMWYAHESKVGAESQKGLKIDRETVEFVEVK